MPKDYISLPYDDYWIEMKRLYVYENGEVYKKRQDGTKGKLMKKYTGTHYRGFFWSLCGRREYEFVVKSYLQETPNPQ